MASTRSATIQPIAFSTLPGWRRTMTAAWSRSAIGWVSMITRPASRRTAVPSASPLANLLAPPNNHTERSVGNAVTSVSSTTFGACAGAFQLSAMARYAATRAGSSPAAITTSGAASPTAARVTAASRARRAGGTCRTPGPHAASAARRASRCGTSHSVRPTTPSPPRACPSSAPRRARPQRTARQAASASIVTFR